jgi:esterase/lipase superfamily enzyme
MVGSVSGYCSQILAQETPVKTVSTTESIDSLEARRLDLEQQLANLRTSTPSDDSPQINAVKEDLLTVTGEEEAIRSQEFEKSKGAFEQPNYLQVPVLFVTDRGKSSNGAFTDVRRQSGLEFGRALTTVKTENGVRSDYIADAQRLPQNTTLKSPVVSSISDISAFLKEISNRKADRLGKPRRVILFVHGYNVSFDDAMRSAAILSTEVQFSNIPIAYSWPSAGTFGGYWHDEAEVGASDVRFTEFLKTLLSQSPVEVVIVCHSMGARLVAAALYKLGDKGTAVPTLHHVVFAASDLYTSDLAEHWPAIHVKDVGFSFYCSNHDLALRLSHIVHRDPRVGDVSPSVYAPLGAYTIDASSVDSMWRAFGHSYIINSFTVGADIGQWIDTNASPLARGLTKSTNPGTEYYLFP